MKMKNWQKYAFIVTILFCLATTENLYMQEMDLRIIWQE